MSEQKNAGAAAPQHNAGRCPWCNDEGVVCNHEGDKWEPCPCVQAVGASDSEPAQDAQQTLCLDCDNPATINRWCDHCWRIAKGT